MKKSLFWGGLIFFCHARAATVLWNALALSTWTGTEGDHGFALSYYHHAEPLRPNETFWVELSCTIAQSGMTTTLTGDGPAALIVRANWIVATLGDIVMESTVRHLSNGNYFARYGQDEDASGDFTPNTLAVEGRESVYLAFAAAGIGETPSDPSPYFYGWVGLEVENGSVSLLGSAIDLDGGPMIVGGGSAIPEPTAALLLLAGGALLALRRREAP